MDHWTKEQEAAAMPARRTAESMEKDAKAASLFRRGLTYRQISAEMGWGSPTSALNAVRRAARDAARDDLGGADALHLMLGRLNDYRRVAWRVASTKHFLTTQSGVVLHPVTREPLLDDSPVLAALDRLLRCDAEENKLRGTYAPTKTRVEVITEDMVDAEISRLMREVEANDGGVAAGLVNEDTAGFADDLTDEVAFAVGDEGGDVPGSGRPGPG
jgi:hypothetical protein